MKNATPMLFLVAVLEVDGAAEPETPAAIAYFLNSLVENLNIRNSGPDSLSQTAIAAPVALRFSTLHASPLPPSGAGSFS